MLYYKEPIPFLQLNAGLLVFVGVLHYKVLKLSSQEVLIPYSIEKQHISKQMIFDLQFVLK
jgi:hypothetical protein